MSANPSRSGSPAPAPGTALTASERDSLLRAADQQKKYGVAPLTQAEQDDKDSSILVAAFMAMLVFQMGNRIFGKLATYPMHNYPLFMSIQSVFIYIPLSFVYIIPTQLFTNNITVEQTSIPKYKFAVMGIFDSIAGIMASFAVNFISNASMIVLVQQSAIPISMAISYYLLRATYSTSQYTGAGVVLMGIVVVLLPNFVGSSAASGAEGDQDGPSQILWLGVLVLSCIPMCLSSVYKEKALGEVEIDVMYLNGWVAIFQFAVAIPLMLPSAGMIGLSADQIIPNLIGGYNCYMGVNTILEGNEQGIAPDDCAMSPLFVNSYLIFNVVYNLLIIVILKHGSANIMWMASTVIVPLSNVAFSMKWMPHHKPMQISDILGLVIIMTGLIIYRFFGTLQSMWAEWTGILSKEQIQQKKLEKIIGAKIERKQTKFIGFNQIEALNTIVDSRTQEEQVKVLYRSPASIRGLLLQKLGIPASPLVAARARYGESPQMGERRVSESWDTIKKKNSFRGSPSIPLRGASPVPRGKYNSFNPQYASNSANNSDDDMSRQGRPTMASSLNQSGIASLGIGGGARPQSNLYQTSNDDDEDGVLMV